MRNLRRAGFWSGVVAIGVSAALVAPAGAASVSASAVPSAPTGVTAVPLTNAIRVSWVAPASSGSCPITGYRIRLLRRDNGLVGRNVVVGPGVRTTTQTKLAARINYGAEVRALNCSGHSPIVVKVARTKKAGPAPVGDTANAVWWLPGGLGGGSLYQEIWKWFPTQFSMPAGQRFIYQKIGTLPVTFVEAPAFVYKVLGPNRLQVTFPQQSSSVAPVTYIMTIDGYDKNLDHLQFTLDGQYTYVVGGCRAAETPLWVCI